MNPRGDNYRPSNTQNHGANDSHASQAHQSNPNQLPSPPPSGSNDHHHFDAIIEPTIDEDIFQFDPSITPSETAEVDPHECDDLPALIPIGDVPSVEDIDLVPTTLVSMQDIGSIKPHRALVALLDSGGSNCMISRNALPKGCQQSTVNPMSFTTTAGQLQALSTVKLSSVFLPEFS